MLVRSMPEDYMSTMSQLKHHLTGDHIRSILESEDPATANQRILDCLIEQIYTKKEISSLLSKWLSSLKDTTSLNTAIHTVIPNREGKYVPS